MPGTLSTLALAAAVAAPDLVLDVPMHPPAPGETLFVRARAIDLAPARAEASWDGRTLRLFPERDGTIPVVLPVPLDARRSLPLEVRVESETGIQRSASTQVLLRTPPAPGSTRWDLPEEVAALANPFQARRERARLDAILASAVTPERLWDGSFAPPLRAPRLAPFGAARTLPGRPAGGEEAPLHRGIDYAVRKGMSVRAPQAGFVLDTPYLPLLGQTVIIDHGQGVVSLLAHLNDVRVARGDRLEPGSVVGRAGATGLSDGPMLHQALFVRGVPVDPAGWERLPDWARVSPAAAGEYRLPDLPGDDLPEGEAPSGPEPAPTPTPTPPPVADGPAPVPDVAVAPAPLPGDPAALAGLGPFAGPESQPAPARSPPPIPRPVPMAATTPPVAPDFAVEELPALLRAGIEARLPGVEAQVALTRPDRHNVTRGNDIEVTLRGMRATPFFTAVEVVSFVTGELTSLTPARTHRITVRDPLTSQSVTFLTRDARQLWRARTGQAPLPGAER